MKTHDLKQYTSIKPESVTRFLSDRGWTELNIKPGIVAMWGVTRGAKDHKILLPLNPDFPDYPNRMIDALETVQTAELINESDLLETLLRENPPSENRKMNEPTRGELLKEIDEWLKTREPLSYDRRSRMIELFNQLPNAEKGLVFSELIHFSQSIAFIPPDEL